MTAPRNPDDLIRAFLGEGQTDLPDRVLDAVRAGVHGTHQRVAIGPWRNPDMSIFARVAIAAVAVLAVGLAWVNLGPKQPSIGGQPTPSPAPSPTLSASPRALTTSVLPLQPGTYVTPDPFLVRVTFTAPAGWEGNLGGPYFAALNPVNRPLGVFFSIFDKVYADPCHIDKGFMIPPVGPTVDDLATALAGMPGLTATPPTDATFGGHAGKQLTLTAPASFAGCAMTPSGYSTWQLPLGANYYFTAGQHSRLWILDVGGQRLVIDAQDVPGETAQERADTQAVLDSIRIAPAK